jgi:PilZ domain
VTTLSKTDLRGAVRFPLQLPVALHANDRTDEGVTHDISAGGVLILCGEEYPVGSTLQFSICMPAQALGSDQDVRVECTGRVVRCTEVLERVAVGVIIDEYHISR